MAAEPPGLAGIKISILNLLKIDFDFIGSERQLNPEVQSVGKEVGSLLGNGGTMSMEMEMDDPCKKKGNGKKEKEEKEEENKDDQEEESKESTAEKSGEIYYFLCLYC